MEVPLDLFDLWCKLAQLYASYNLRSSRPSVPYPPSHHTITVCCEPRIGYLQLTAMLEASAAGAQTGAIEHWTCAHCSIMHLEEATPAPERAPVAEPEPMQVDDGEAERSPIGLYADDRHRNIVHVEEEIIRVSSLPPAIRTPSVPHSSSPPPPTAGPSNPTYETPLYLLSFQRQARLVPGQGVSEPLTLLPSPYEGVFTQRGGRSRAKGLLKHLCQ